LPQGWQRGRQLGHLHRRLSDRRHAWQRRRQRGWLGDGDIRGGNRSGRIFVWHKNHTVRARLALLDPWVYWDDWELFVKYSLTTTKKTYGF